MAILKGPFNSPHLWRSARGLASHHKFLFAKSSPAFEEKTSCTLDKVGPYQL